MPTGRPDCRSALAKRHEILVTSYNDLDALALFEASGVGQVEPWTTARYSLEIDNPSSRYLMFRLPGRNIAGTALLRGFAEADLAVDLIRLVTANQAGTRRLVVKDLLRWIFQESNTNRIQVKVPAEDNCTKTLFECLGFVAEGVLREASPRPDGTLAAMWLMSILRREWPGTSAAAVVQMLPFPLKDGPIRGGVF